MRKLRLSRVTLRDLSAADLRSANGGETGSANCTRLPNSYTPGQTCPITITNCIQCLPSFRCTPVIG